MYIIYYVVYLCLVGSDYDTREYNVKFPVRVTSQFIVADVIDDNIVEDTEYYNLSVATPQYRDVRIDRYSSRYRYNVTKIIIYDNDSEYLHT